MVEKDQQIKSIEKQMINIKNHTWTMVENFKKSHFFLSVAQNMQYDDDLVFNETNVLQFLAELEEYISLFITYMAYKQENPDAAISSLSLEHMAIKEFDKKDINIDAPNAGEVNLQNDETDAEDDVITDPRSLYKRFDDLWTKDNKAL